MKTEEKKRMLARSHNVGDAKPHRIKFMERMHPLPDNHEEIVRRLEEKYKSIDEYQSTRIWLLNMLNMRERLNHPEGMYIELWRIALAMHEFVIDKNLYMKKDSECPYHSDGIPVCSTPCLECSSCLGVLEGHGVICGQRLKEANVSLPNDE